MFLCQKIGGARGIRTLAPVARSNDLANRPLQPLEYRSTCLTRSFYRKTADLSNFSFTHTKEHEK